MFKSPSLVRYNGPFILQNFSRTYRAHPQDHNELVQDWFWNGSQDPLLAIFPLRRWTQCILFTEHCGINVYIFTATKVNRMRKSE